MGSSDSLPVSFSTKPEPRPLICTRAEVSVCICLTNKPCGPTILALTLKLRKESRPTGRRSSGHFLLSRGCCCSSLCLARKSVTRGPRSLDRSFSTAATPAFRISWVGAVICRKRAGSLSLDFDLSGSQVPFVMTVAPVSCLTYKWVK